MTFESVLYAAEQPVLRSGNTYRYRVSGGRGLTVRLDSGGHVARLIERG